jgi:hypothetical protein
MALLKPQEHRRLRLEMVMGTDASLLSSRRQFTGRPVAVDGRIPKFFAPAVQSMTPRAIAGIRIEAIPWAMSLDPSARREYVPSIRVAFLPLLEQPVF